MTTKLTRDYYKNCGLSLSLSPSPSLPPSPPPPPSRYHHILMAVRSLLLMIYTYVVSTIICPFYPLSHGNCHKGMVIPFYVIDVRISTLSVDCHATYSPENVTYDLTVNWTLLPYDQLTSEAASANSYIVDLYSLNLLLTPRLEAEVRIKVSNIAGMRCDSLR